MGRASARTCTDTLNVPGAITSRQARLTGARCPAMPAYTEVPRHGDYLKANAG
jgi:hypothetical protein